MQELLCLKQSINLDILKQSYMQKVKNSGNIVSKQLQMNWSSVSVKKMESGETSGSLKCALQIETVY